MFTAVLVVVIGFVLLPLVSRFMHLLPVFFIIGAGIAITGVGMFLLPYIAGILAVYGFCKAVMKKIGGGGD